MKRTKKLLVSLLTLAAIGVGMIGATGCDMDDFNELFEPIDSSVEWSNTESSVSSEAESSADSTSEGEDSSEVESSADSVSEGEDSSEVESSADSVSEGEDSSEVESSADSTSEGEDSSEVESSADSVSEGEDSVEDEESGPSEGLEYTLSLNGTYYSVTGIGTCTDTEIVIPSTYEGLFVKEIGYNAFSGCSSLTGIVIPDCVTYIGIKAFERCSNLTEIVISDGVTSIGYDAFKGCSVLTEIVIPDSVTSIGSSTFSGCSSLTEIIVGENNTQYSSLDGNLYNKDQTILMQYSIGKNDSSFAIPDSVTSIGSSAFYGCRNLTEIVIPDSVTSIGSFAFYGCSSLRGIVIPDSVTSIGSRAFYGCSVLTEIVIPDSVTSIDSYVFSECRSLTEIVIPDSVTSIGQGVFSWCGSLTSIIFKGTTAQWNAINKGSNWNYDVPATEIVCLGDTPAPSPASEGLEYALSDDETYYIVTGIGTCTDTEIVIPSTYNGKPVTSIGREAFYNCFRLTEIVIPDSVTSIGYEAFSRCSSLISLTFENPNGWKCTNRYGSYTISSSELSDPLTAARTYSGGYDDYTWTREE